MCPGHTLTPTQPQGMGQAVNTLCSQAYGAKQYHMVGTWLQIALTGVSFICIPIGFSWWFTEPVLRATGFHGDTAALAGTFARYSIIGLWPGLVAILARQYLQVQHKQQQAGVRGPVGCLTQLNTCLALTDSPNKTCCLPCLSTSPVRASTLE